MAQRFVSIWFPHLITDRMLRRRPELEKSPFAMALNERGRRVVKAVNIIAQSKGVYPDMAVADCRALVPELEILDFEPEQPQKLLNALAEWCIRYTPHVSVDLPAGLFLDATGCAHLWGGEHSYLSNMQARFQTFGYSTRMAIADTIGTAWAVCHFGQDGCIVGEGAEQKALSSLPADALRLDTQIVERLKKLGLNTIGQFMNMPRTALRRRFGKEILKRIDQALGGEFEFIDPITPVAPYQERLPSLESICTATGIEIALKNLIETLCQRLIRESKGLRRCELRCYRVDGIIQKIEIGTNRPSRNTVHLFKLFENKIQEIEPDLGIELFILEAPVVEDLNGTQDALWTATSANEIVISELLDQLGGKIGGHAIHRYLPDEHYWPERSIKSTSSLTEKSNTNWRTDLPRPMHLLPRPVRIEVSVIMPDYPPLLFWYKGTLHTVKKADGPERIEQEWWIEAGQYRDYYCVEDDQGVRYWLFRLGDYNSGNVKWFLHGFFA